MYLRNKDTCFYRNSYLLSISARRYIEDVEDARKRAGPLYSQARRRADPSYTPMEEFFVTSTCFCQGYVQQVET